MRLILFLGIVLMFTVAMDNGMLPEDIINCSSVSENLPISEVIPLRYNVRIVVRPYQRILSGYMNILIDVIKRTGNISLHAASTLGYEAEVNKCGLPPNDLDFYI